MQLKIILKFQNFALHVNTNIVFDLTFLFKNLKKKLWKKIKILINNFLKFLKFYNTVMKYYLFYYFIID